MAGRAGVFAHPTAKGSRPGGWKEPFAPLSSSEHYCRSSREAPTGLRDAPPGPRVSAAPGERAMAPPRSTRRATSCSVLFRISPRSPRRRTAEGRFARWRPEKHRGHIFLLRSGWPRSILRSHKPRCTSHVPRPETDLSQFPHRAGNHLFSWAASCAVFAATFSAVLVIPQARNRTWRVASKILPIPLAWVGDCQRRIRNVRISQCCRPGRPTQSYRPRKHCIV